MIWEGTLLNLLVPSPSLTPNPLLDELPQTSIPEIAAPQHLTTRAPEKNIKKQKRLLKRIGPAKGGHWKVEKH